ncbi:PIN domain-like protein, partial [Mycena metata]
HATQILGPAAQTRSLLNLTTIEGYQRARPHRTLVIGVDIRKGQNRVLPYPYLRTAPSSVRISATVAVLQTAGVFHPGAAGEKLVLQKLFSQLRNFLLAPATMLFVFDGPGRPDIKRGTKVVHRPRGLTDCLKRMITNFGYYFYDAPGEAEAELGQLNERGLIDGIITEDSDAFLFGGRLVIRTLGPTTQHNSLIYAMDSIENTDSVSLDKAGLILCALLLGGDYHSGIPGVGPNIAHAIAALGFGTDLVDILVCQETEGPLVLWRGRLREELRTNSSGRLSKRWPNLAKNIPDTFPSLEVANLYLNPLTSASAGYAGPMPAGFWPPQEPAIFELTNLYSTLFGWSGGDLLTKLNATVWPGVAFRMMCSVSKAPECWCSIC